MPSGGQNKIISAEVEAKIIELMAEGKLDAEIARELGFHASCLTKWRIALPQFDYECSRAQAIAFDQRAQSLLTAHIDIEDVQKAKLYSDNVKWHLSKCAAAKYGDRIDVNIQGTVDLNAALTAATKRVAYTRHMENIQEAEVIESKAIEHSVHPASESGRIENQGDHPASKDGSPTENVNGIFD